MLLSIVTGMQLQAQVPIRQDRPIKPELFGDFSGRPECNPLLFKQLFSFHKGDTFSLSLPGNLVFHVEVLEKVEKTPQTTSMNLRISNFKDALFNLSITTDIANIQTIRARVIHPRYGDVLNLKLENGRYYLQKEEQRLFLTE